MRKKTTLALVLMMNLACAMAQKSGTTLLELQRDQ